MAHLIPTRKVVSDTWEAYASLCQAAAKDPILGSDAEFVSARDRAHKRWSEAFEKWSGQ